MKVEWLAELQGILGAWWAARPRMRTIASYPRRDLFVVIGFALVAAASTVLVWGSPLVADAAVQLEMARSFAATGEFRVNGEVSHFYPPTYPLLLVVPGLLLGFSSAMVHAVQAFLFGAIVLSTYFVGAGIRRSAGLVAAGLVACNPVLLSEAGEGRATLLAALLFVWLFHFVRLGLKNDAHLGWAGLTAGLLYLTKDTAGYVALLGIAAGLIWRAQVMGWKGVLTSAHYRLAAALFLALVGFWGLRNTLYFGSPVTNPGVIEYTDRFLFHTAPAEILLLVFGSALLLASHWALWASPALLDKDIGRWVLRRPSRPRADALASALLLFLLTTLLLSALMAGIFIRNQGNLSFPASVELYYRFLAVADPVLMICIAILITRPTKAPQQPIVRDAIRLGKVAAVAVILLLSWSSVIHGSQVRASAYVALESFLLDAGVTEGYSEASVLFVANLAGVKWIPVALDFSGPFLDFQAAGVPGGSTIVTVGITPAADFTSGGFSVILNVSWDDPPVVQNPFYEP